MIFGKLKNSDDIFPTQNGIPEQLASSNDLQKPIYCDIENKSYKSIREYEHVLAHISPTCAAVSNFSPVALTSFGSANKLVADGQYKLFSSAANGGLYGSIDGNTWEKIELPFVVDADLNTKPFSVLAYFNGKFVIIAKDGTYYTAQAINNVFSNWTKIGSLANYNNIAQCNPISKLSDNSFAVFGSTSCNGFYVITDFTTTKYYQFSGICINSVNRVSDQIYVATGSSTTSKGGVLLTTEGLDGSWSKPNVTGIQATTGSWSWKTSYYDSARDIVLVCGDGGDLSTTAADGRHTDIWYSDDKCQTWKHAIFSGLGNGKYITVGKIVEFTDKNESKTLIAVGNVNKSINIALLKSQDGVNWRAATDLTYSRSDSSTNSIKDLTIAKLNQTDYIIYNDEDTSSTANKFKTYNVNLNWLSEEIASVPYMQSSFSNNLSCDENAYSLNAAIHNKVLKTYSYEDRTYEELSPSARYTSNTYGARVLLNTYFSGIGANDDIILSSVTFHANSAMNANSFVVKVLDSNNNVIGSPSLGNTAATGQDSPVKYVFPDPVIIPGSTEFVKIITYAYNYRDTLGAPGFRVKQHGTEKSWGGYQNSIDNVIGPEFNFIRNFEYSIKTKIDEQSCADKILSYEDETRTSITVDGRIYRPGHFTGTDSEGHPCNFMILSAEV